VACQPKETTPNPTMKVAMAYGYDKFDEVQFQSLTPECSGWILALFATQVTEMESIKEANVDYADLPDTSYTFTHWIFPVGSNLPES